MKIYFAGSIRGGRDDKEIYFQIIALLQTYGQVATEHVGDSALSAHGEVNVTDQYIYERDMAWLRDADIVVAEVSTPSLGVGYEIASAEASGKKILCLYREDAVCKISGMINGNKNLTIKTYKTVEDLPEVFRNFFK